MGVRDVGRGGEPSSASSSSAASVVVLKKEEEALITLMKERALTHCAASQKAYYECVKGRMVSVAWACRAHATEMSACLHQHTSDDVLDALKEKWVRAGKPNIADRSRTAFVRF